MSEEEGESEKSKKQLKSNYTSRKTFNNSATIRNNLDPRQNRNNNANKKSFSNQSFNKRKLNNDEDDLLLVSNHQDSSNKTVMDEKNSVSNNPLDFLTKFINNSANDTQISTIKNDITGSTTSKSSSTNLSYLVDSLKKFVNTSTSKQNSNYPDNYIPHQQSQFYDNSINNSFMHQSNIINQQRSTTPTKDEIFQQQHQQNLIQSIPPLPQLQAPIDSNTPYPQLPYTHPISYQPNQMIYQPIFLQASPLHPSSQHQPLMLIDPNNCYQHSSNSKLIINSPLSSTTTNLTSNTNNILNKPNSPNNPTYWASTSQQSLNGFINTQQREPFNKETSINFMNNDSKHTNNNRNSNKKNCFEDQDNDKLNTKSNTSNLKHQQHKIPTINSQRDRETNYNRNNNNNINGSGKSNRY